MLENVDLLAFGELWSQFSLVLATLAERARHSLPGREPEVKRPEIVNIGINTKNYSKTCLKRPPHGARESGRYRQVVS